MLSAAVQLAKKLLKWWNLSAKSSFAAALALLALPSDLAPECAEEYDEDHSADRAVSLKNRCKIMILLCLLFRPRDEDADESRMIGGHGIFWQIFNSPLQSSIDKSSSPP